MSILRTEMPLLARHEGDWIGTYTIVNAEGNLIDKYNSHLTCQFPSEGYPYYQINRYTWPDGKREEYQFPATYRDKKIWFDTDRLEGYAWEADELTIILTWTYKNVSDAYLYEMIQISRCGNYRARTWHWFKNNQIFQRTLITEERMK